MRAGREAYLGLGANLGNRMDNLARACAALVRGGIVIGARSPIYETAPVGPLPQPDYLNAVVCIVDPPPARVLLELCLAVEGMLGRVRLPGLKGAPRLLDIDVLLVGDERHDEPDLRVPHPELLGRAFVRVPLAHVARPGLRHPVSGEPLDRVPAGLEGVADVRLVAHSEDWGGTPRAVVNERCPIDRLRV